VGESIAALLEGCQVIWRAAAGTGTLYYRGVWASLLLRFLVGVRLFGESITVLRYWQPVVYGTQKHHDLC